MTFGQLLENLGELFGICNMAHNLWGNRLNELFLDRAAFSEEGAMEDFKIESSQLKLNASHVVTIKG